VDARHIVYAALGALARENRVKMSLIKRARKQFDIDAEKTNPLFT
jgi:pyruvate dehydrogenase E1 component